jgi:hypothetical protein
MDMTRCELRQVKRYSDDVDEKNVFSRFLTIIDAAVSLRQDLKDKPCHIADKDPLYQSVIRTDATIPPRKAFEQKVEPFNERMRQYLDRPIMNQKLTGGGT